MFMKRKIKSAKGFTLAELLIVVAIIAVLVAIGIPIFTSQLEKSREAVDLSDVRSAYAEVMMAAITGDTVAIYTKDASQTIYKQDENVYSITVKPLKQKQDGWQTALPITIGGVSSTDNTHWFGNPGANGECVITYVPPTGAADEAVKFEWKGGTGEDNSGTGGNGGGDSGNNGSGNGNGNNGTDNGENNSSGDSQKPGTGTIKVTWPDFTVNNVIPFAIGNGNVTVKKGNVYSYLGRYYVCIQDHSAESNWSDYSSIIPNGNKWPYVELVLQPNVLTQANLNYENDSIGHFNNVNKGTIYKSQNGIYIMKDDFQGWFKSPEQEISNWVKINQ